MTINPIRPQPWPDEMLDHRSEVLLPARQRYLKGKGRGGQKLYNVKSRVFNGADEIVHKKIVIIVQDYIPPYNKLRLPLLSSIAIKSLLILIIGNPSQAQSLSLNTSSVASAEIILW